MSSFSKRYGYEPIKGLQFESMDDDLKRRIWDIVDDCNQAGMLPREVVWVYWQKRRRGEYSRWSYSIEELYEAYNEAEFNKVYDLLELMWGQMAEWDRQKFEDALNEILLENDSGWKMVEGQMEPVIGEESIDALHQASTISEQAKLHAEKAIRHINPTNPDYEASIVESIKMIEAVAKRYSKKTGLSGILEDIDSRAGLHPKVKDAFKKMYDFSNKSGARHAAAEPGYTVDINDAQIVLVWCAAMANYIERRCGRGHS